MPSNLHSLIQQTIADTLVALGYSVKMEYQKNGKRYDVFAQKEGSTVKVEVVNSHMPDWLPVIVQGEIMGCPFIRKSVRVNQWSEDKDIPIKKGGSFGKGINTEPDSTRPHLTLPYIAAPYQTGINSEPQRVDKV